MTEQELYDKEPSVRAGLMCMSRGLFLQEIYRRQLIDLPKQQMTDLKHGLVPKGWDIVTLVRDQVGISNFALMLDDDIPTISTIVIQTTDVRERPTLKQVMAGKAMVIFADSL